MSRLSSRRAPSRFHGLAVKICTAGRSKFRRTSLDIPQMHALGAVCVGVLGFSTGWSVPQVKVHGPWPLSANAHCQVWLPTWLPYTHQASQWCWYRGCSASLRILRQEGRKLYEPSGSLGIRQLQSTNRQRGARDFTQTLLVSAACRCL